MDVIPWGGSRYVGAVELRREDDHPDWWLWAALPRLELETDGRVQACERLYVDGHGGTPDLEPALIVDGDKFVWFVVAERPCVVQSCSLYVAHLPTTLRIGFRDGRPVGRFRVYRDGRAQPPVVSTASRVTLTVTRQTDVTVEFAVEGSPFFLRAVVGTK